MDRLGKYEIRGILGRGAMGTVYEAWDPHIARRVAIKTVRLPGGADSEEREVLGRFQQEAQAAGRLQHPNIVGVFDYAETDELAYIVMEFVEGRTLKALLDINPAPDLQEIGHMMGGLLAGLAYSHSHQVIHRDIKPANVIVTPDGQVKIADFGIARIAGSGMTLAGTIMGTPAYMSPEQFKSTEIDSRTDIYSAGVLLFQMLTGKRPFEGNMATIMQAVLNQPAPRPSGQTSKVSPALDTVVARAMAHAPADRYPDAASFDRALQEALRAPPPTPALSAGLGDLLDDDVTIVRSTTREPPAATPKPSGAPKPPPGGKPASHRPVMLAGLAVLLLATGGAGYVLFGRGAVKPDVHTVGTTHDAKPIETSSDKPELHDPQPGSAKPDVTGDATQDGANPPETHEQRPPTHDPTMSASSGTVAGTSPTTHSSDPVATVKPPPPPLPVGAVASAVSQVSCTAASVDEAPAGTIRIRGIATASGDRSLHEAVPPAAQSAPLDWQVTTAYGPYCSVLDALRPYINQPAGAAVTAGLRDGRTALVKDELVVPRIVMPDSSALLQLDYISNDGGVVHVRQALPGTPYPPGAAPVFGQPEDKGQTYPVDQPYGTDLLIAIASSTPLFTVSRTQIETLPVYMRDLRAALDQAAAKGARLSASILLLRTSLP